MALVTVRARAIRIKKSTVIASLDPEDREFVLSYLNLITLWKPRFTITHCPNCGMQFTLNQIVLRFYGRSSKGKHRKRFSKRKTGATRMFCCISCFRSFHVVDLD